MTTKQRMAWQQAKQEARQLTDGHGMPIDTGILETVAILRLMGITTSSSCAGHLRRMTSGPYVRLESVESRKLQIKYNALYRKGCENNAIKRKGLLEKIIKFNIEEMEKLLPYLERFYKTHDTPYTRRLIIDGFGPTGYDLKCQGSALRHIAHQQVKKEILENNQVEMSAFTNHLIEAYFTEG